MKAESETPLLKVRLTPTAERAVIDGHPWVYSDRIKSVNRKGRTGEFAVIYSRNDRFLAIGLFDENSPITLRIFHKGKPVQLNSDWWTRHLRDGLEKRNGLFDLNTSGYRCLNGENDGWPGLVLDRYGSCYVIKIYTAAWLPHLSRITECIDKLLEPKRVILRLSRNIVDSAKTLSISDGQSLKGSEEGMAEFLENGYVFEADPVMGQKTGFFLDQRDNRAKVGSLSKDADVLNLFSHVGGFSIHAAGGGAKSALDIDLSRHALQACERHFELNNHHAVVKQCSHTTRQADVFQWLEARQKDRFDIVIVDPPSLARKASEKTGAIQAYATLTSEAVRLVRREGILVSSSCSAHVSAHEFFTIIRETVQQSGRKWVELDTTHHAADHPATFKEGEYLKCIYIRLLT